MNGANAGGGQQPQNLVINFASDVQINGIYANAVSVHVNLNEVIIDFGYSVPNMKPEGEPKGPQEIQIIQRVNLNHRTAESFVTVMQNALLDFRNKVNAANQPKPADGGGASVPSEQ